MRRAMLFLIGLLFGACTATAPAAAAPSQGPDHVAGAQALESKTVALLSPTDGSSVICSGVWVSSTTILTALHCVDGDVVIPYVVREDVFPRGSKKLDEDFTPRFALTYAIDVNHDLALLRAPKPPTGHGVAHTRIGTVEQGMFAQAMGMPLGLWFSYATGVVSAVRVMLDLGDDHDTTYVQTTVPTSPGCSGGGLFDRSGDLIGVTHASMTRGQQINFYVHKSHVDALLHAQGSKL